GSVYDDLRQDRRRRTAALRQTRARSRADRVGPDLHDIGRESRAMHRRPGRTALQGRRWVAGASGRLSYRRPLLEPRLFGWGPPPAIWQVGRKKGGLKTHIARQ